MKKKHTKNEYIQWMTNLFQIETPIVIFTNEPGLFSQFDRNNIKIIISKIAKVPKIIKNKLLFICINLPLYIKNFI